MIKLFKGENDMANIMELDKRVESVEKSLDGMRGAISNIGQQNTNSVEMIATLNEALAKLVEEVAQLKVKVAKLGKNTSASTYQ